MSAEQERLARLKDNLERRAQLFDLTRRFFQKQGFLEVETPARVPAVAPEANIVPLESEDWYLITSPELHMKRLLAAGYERIFQISRCFRRAERGRLHNPEFSLLEWYRANADYSDIIEDTEQLLLLLADRVLHSTCVQYQGRAIDLTPPWEHLSVRRAYIKYAGWDPVNAYDAGRFDEDMAIKIMPSLPVNRPVILKDYPHEAASLARLKLGEPDVAERAEVFLGGLELANAYSELNDRKEQMWRFSEEAAMIEKTQGRRVPLPRSFLEAVGHMPPAGGIALGMDRLAMLFCDAASIDEVLAFSVESA
jgi:lysyl-tRNA synthetase class 2